MYYPDMVVFSHAEDEHALAFMAAISSNRHPLLLDVGREGLDFVTTLDNSGRITIRTRNGDQFDLTNVSFWWNRRPLFRHHPGTSSRFAVAQETEITNFWCGLFDIPLEGIWCNNFQSQFRTKNKLRQLFVATRCGMRVPKTIWSDDPEEIRSFWERNNRSAVIKMFEGTKEVWQPTREITPEIIENRNYFRFSPSIVQEFIGGTAEYRIVIFGDYKFVARNMVGSSRYPYDVRIDTLSKYEAIEHESSLVEPLIRYMKSEGLSYAAFDVRENVCGEPIFLEVNPMGQFLYLDRCFEGKILKSFCYFAESSVKSDRPIIQSKDEKFHDIWSGSTTAPFFEAISDHINHLT